MTVRLSNEDANGIAFKLISTDKRCEVTARRRQKVRFRYTKLDLAVKQKLKYEAAMLHDPLNSMEVFYSGIR